jgi:cytochrome c551/c552
MSRRVAKEKPRNHSQSAPAKGFNGSASSGAGAGQLTRRVKVLAQKIADVYRAQAISIEELQPVLMDLKQIHRQSLDWIAELKADGAGKDAAHMAFFSEQCCRVIEQIESQLSGPTPDQWRQLADHYTGNIAIDPKIAELASSYAQRHSHDADANRRAFKRTGNPLYVFETVAALCVDKTVQLLPGWCAGYLGRIAAEILEIAHSNVAPKDAVAMVPQVLGLTQQGSNAFRTWRSAADLQDDGDLYNRVKASHGIRDKEASEAAAELWSLGDERSVRRRVSKARAARVQRTNRHP